MGESAALSPAPAAEAEQLKQALLAFEAPYLEEKLLHDGVFATRAECRRAFVELMKYFWLSAVAGRELPMPSLAVDEVWHQFILFTREYHAFCDRYFGAYLHHQPNTDQGAPTAADTAQVLEFFRTYQEHFGGLPALWNDRSAGPDAALVLADSLARESMPAAEMDYNVGVALMEQGKLIGAVAYLRRALRLQPDYAAAHHQLGLALSAQNQFDESLASFQEAVRLEPRNAAALADLAAAYKDQGRLDEALDCYRKAREVEPDNAALHSSLLFTLLYHADTDAAALFGEQLSYGRLHAVSDAAAPPIRRPAPGRRLRVGYVSADFRMHVAAFFLEPFLEAHDRDRFEIFCYGDVPQPDWMTQRLRGYAEHWRSLAGTSNAQAAAIIRQDQVDILVDLSGHTGGNRLPVFARKPAPIQATYHAYMGSTGLAAMDYRITDGHADPPGLTERYHTEKLVRLPEVGLCYRHTSSPEVNPLPADRSGPLTFGSFNTLAKVSDAVLSLWSRVLRAAPHSRLVIKTGSGSQGDRRVRKVLAWHGIGAERVTLLGRVAGRAEYLQLYHAVDVCLDTFPYNGITTTCDALWMGVPVLTLAGRTSVARQGVSMLRAVGVPELIADTPDDYVAAASRLAGELRWLRTLRSDLRERMRQSPLTDASRFTRHLEAAYQHMWERGA